MNTETLEKLWSVLSEDEKIEFALAIGRKWGLEEALDYVECSSKEAAIVRIRQRIEGLS